MKAREQLTHLTLSSPRIVRAERALILADLHEQARENQLALWLSLSPTLVLIAGDWLELHSRSGSRREAALAQLRALAKICPVYCALGNHELGLRGNLTPRGLADATQPLPPAVEKLVELLQRNGAIALCDRFVHHNSLCIGGLCSSGGRYLSRELLSSMEREEGFRLLLCHHPEYYGAYIRVHDIELTVSGHAHGGQWRLFQRGVYAPGQGLFPRYTDGYYDGGRLLVSRGLSERFPVPRIGNPRQTILLELIPES